MTRARREGKVLVPGPSRSCGAMPQAHGPRGRRAFARSNTAPEVSRHARHDHPVRLSGQPGRGRGRHRHDGRSVLARPHGAVRHPGRPARGGARRGGRGRGGRLCGQEVARIAEIAAEAGLPAPAHVDIRDRAGWSAEAAAAGPKQAALVADALLARPSTRVADVVSEGLCLVIGPAERAIPAAERLAGLLAVTVLLPEEAELPLDRRFEVVVGRLGGARGALGGFTVAIDALRQLRPGGRGAWAFTEPRDGASSACDVILDLSGGTPLFPAHGKREGYLRPDPRDPQAVADAILAGEPAHRYVREAAPPALRARALRTLPRLAARLQPLSGGVPNERHHLGGRARGDRHDGLRGLRRLRRAVPVAGHHLRRPARRTRVPPDRHARAGLPPGRRPRAAAPGPRRARGRDDRARRPLRRGAAGGRDPDGARHRVGLRPRGDAGRAGRGLRRGGRACPAGARTS